MFMRRVVFTSPWLLIATILILVFVSNFIEDSNQVPQYIKWLLEIIIGIYWVFWIFFVYKHFAVMRSHFHDPKKKVIEIPFILFLLGSINVFFSEEDRVALLNTPEFIYLYILLEIAGFIFGLVLFYICWKNSWMLIHAENRPTSKFFQFIGNFLLFAWWPIGGALFLHGRLKKLDLQLNEIKKDLANQ